MKVQRHHSTTGRKRMAYVTTFFYLVATVFLLLVNIGQIANRSTLIDWYFFRFDVSNIIPYGVPQAALINSIAGTLGLHDFYDVGMWNYCQGYFDQGITDCSAPVAMYWFNPVAILQSQLLRGASITLPDEVTQYLSILQLASQAMFVCFLVALLASFVSMLLAPSAVLSKLWTILLAFLGWCAALAAVLAAGISTGMWTIFSAKLEEYAADINIVPTLGVPMFVFQWIGAGAALVAALIQTGLMCCGTSRRDVRRSMRASSPQMRDI